MFLISKATRFILAMFNAQITLKLLIKRHANLHDSIEFALMKQNRVLQPGQRDLSGKKAPIMNSVERHLFGLLWIPTMEIP